MVRKILFVLKICAWHKLMMRKNRAGMENGVEEKKLDRRIEKTEMSIRTAIMQLIIDKDYSRITIKELADKANINRKTFYMHYNSIQEVVEEIQNEIIDSLMVVIDQYNYLDTNFDAYVLFHSLNQIINANYDFYKRIISANSYEFLIIKVKDVLKHKLTEKFKNQIEMPDAQFYLYAEYLASGIMSMYTEWFEMEQQPSLEVLAEAASKISFGGVKLAVLEESPALFALGEE